jgi:hypothetical protein
MPAPLIYDEQFRLSAVPAIAAETLIPTATEVAAGTDLTSYVPKSGGITLPAERRMIDTSSIDRLDDSEYPGGTAGTLVLNLKRKNFDGDEAAWTLFKDGLVETYLVMGFEGSNDTAADEVDVYKVVSHIPSRSNPDGGNEQRFSVSCGVQRVARGVAVAAGA